MGGLIDCPACEGEGLVAVTVKIFEHGCGFSHDDIEEHRCADCNGTGQVWVEDEMPARGEDWTNIDAALEADGEKLRQLTGQDHGPFLAVPHVHCPVCGHPLNADGACPSALHPYYRSASSLPEGWDRDESKAGTIFHDHTCYRCRDGELPCPHKGKERNCDTLRARND